MKRIDLTKGSVLKTLLIYAMPLITTNVVQLLFHATDVWVLGVMVDDMAVAAVGASGAIINLLVNLFNGLATGSNVLVSRLVGAKDKEGAMRATGTSLVVGLLSGIILMVVAVIGAPYFLVWMKCQPQVLSDATLYLRIYFMGMPIMMLYNFVAAILRGTGDSVRPMAYMLISGVLNVGLNVLFIAAFDLTVAGVALATVLSNLVSLALGLAALFKNNGYCRAELQNIRIRKWELTEIVKIGVPSALCGLFYYVSNLFVSSGVNSMSTEAMTANAISNQFDSIVYTIGLSVAIACLAMVGQCLGSRDLLRIRKTVWIGASTVTVASLCVGGLFVLLSPYMLGLMTDSLAVIEIARDKMTVLCLTYFITSIMEVLSFSLRALGAHTSTLVVGIVCGFFIRSSWVWFIWPLNKTLGMIYYAYPVSALCAVIIYVVSYAFVIKKMKSSLRDSHKTLACA